MQLSAPASPRIDDTFLLSTRIEGKSGHPATLSAQLPTAMPIDADQGLASVGARRRVAMHKVRQIILAFSLALSVGGPASAQVMLDVSKLTCWQFVTYKVTSPISRGLAERL